MQAILSDENRSSYVTTDAGRILASGLSKETALKFAAVNSLIRLAQNVVRAGNASLGLRESLVSEADKALQRAGVIAIVDDAESVEVESEHFDSIGE